MPPHWSSELALEPESINAPSVCRDRFGLGTTKSLPLELSGSPPASKLGNTAMLLGRVANLAMCWVKKWFLLWRNFSGALMKAILKGIAKGAGRLAAAAPLEKVKQPLGGKELGRDKSKINNGGKLNCEADHQGLLILNSLESWSQEDAESLILEDGHFGEYPGQFFSVKMGTVDLEDNTALHLIRHAISFDTENYSESSSDEDLGLGDAECLGVFPRNSLGGLGIGEYFEGSCSPREEFGDFENDLEGDSGESAESPSISQESIEHSWDFVMFEEESVESTSDTSEGGEYLSQDGKAKENLGTSTASYSFESPLVLSLFYSPSEGEDDDDDSEDWSSEDEMEEAGQSCLDGAVSENGESSSAAKDNSQHQDYLENFCGSYCPSMDPLSSRCVSRSTQPASVAPPAPKNHKEITVSFHSRKPSSKPEESCNPPKPSSPKDPRSATGHLSLHQRCQLETRRNRDLVTAETSLRSQKESQIVKKVRFSPEVTVHTLVVWDYASRAARRGPWEEMARDRCRFQRRIAEVGAILEPCLKMEHRVKAWRKIHGALDVGWPHKTDDAVQSSAGREMLSV